MYASVIFDNFSEKLVKGAKDMMSLPRFLAQENFTKWGDVQWSAKELNKLGTLDKKTKFIREKLKKAGHITDDFTPGIKTEYIKEALRPYNSIKTGEINRFWKGYDKVMSAYKTLVTVPFPSYHARNAISNTWNSIIMGGARAEDLVTAIKISRKLRKGKPLSKTEQRLVEEAIENGVIRDSDKYLKELMDAGEFADAAGNTGLYRRAAAGGWKFAGEIENASRLGHYISMRRQGQTISDATASVRKYLFNYDELSQFERKVMRRGAFFYTFSRKNVPLVLENLTNPWARAWSSAIGRSNEKPEDLPDWMWDSQLAFVGKATEWEKAIPFLGMEKGEDWVRGYNLGLPIAEPFQTFKNPISAMSPLIKPIFELTTGQNLFTQRPLETQTKAPRVISELAKFFPQAQPYLEDAIGYTEDEHGIPRTSYKFNYALGASPLSRFGQSGLEGLFSAGMVRQTRKNPFLERRNRQAKVIEWAKSRNLLREFKLFTGEGKGKDLAKFLNQ
jgi:hypothetical protein